MGKQQKLKGGAFERRVCKALSLSLSHGERDDLFWRSAMSGGRATIGMQQGIVRQSGAGDITAVDPAGAALTNHFIVECKDYKSLDWRGIIYNQKPEIAQFWNRLCEDGDALLRIPLLVAKESYKKPFLITDVSGIGFLESFMEGVHVLDTILCSPALNRAMHFCSLDAL